MKSLEFYPFLITEESHSASKLRKKLERRPSQNTAKANIATADLSYVLNVKPR